ncbi:uncharacterized protein LOC100213694 [Hydra vulgaris]|uniref:uncharacterized protein LOC100213694 n=1 Tax=Hydra vulgaris TaxID=6087 RepID=UPI001F5F0005|nr:uncharacterized protein LOC100213694 [Hydra vulgaris]
MNCKFDNRETAWYSWDEWMEVGTLLYCFSDIQSQMKGINMVNVWKSRVRNGTLPISVELTASLVASYIGTNEENVTEDQQRLSMSMAIVRFVNGVTDQLQTGVYAQSVQVIADQIKIPDWIVDLRHEATHSHLPSTDILKSSVMFALTWLSENYWKETLSKLKKKEEFVDKKLCEYSDFVSLFLKTNSMKSFKKKKNKKLCKYTAKCVKKSFEFVKLVHSGNLKVIIKHVFKKILISTSYFQLPITSLNEEWSKECFKSINILIILWKPLLSYLSLFPEFQELIFLEVINSSKNMELSIFVILFVLYKLKFYSSKVIGFLMNHPSKLSFSLLRCYVRDREFPQKEVVMKVLHLFESTQNFLSKSQNVDVQSLISIPQKEIVSKLKKELDIEEESTHFQSWTLATQTSLKNLPPVGEFKQEYNIDILNVFHKTFENTDNNLLSNESFIQTESSFKAKFDEDFVSDIDCQYSFSDSSKNSQLSSDIDFTIFKDSDVKEHDITSKPILHLTSADIFIF